MMKRERERKYNFIKRFVIGQVCTWGMVGTATRNEGM